LNGIEIEKVNVSPMLMTKRSGQLRNSGTKLAQASKIGSLKTNPRTVWFHIS
jgi:hypothetical protein